jgi:transcriptional regulator with XRE-family HTH domain
MINGPAPFAILLRASRTSAGLSQEELATRSGMSVRAIGNLERGRIRWPHPASVRRLADALDLSGQSRRVFLAATQRRLVNPAASGAPAVGPADAGGA